ncbi:MAG: UDP-N-acetylglucosamine 2-epimerase (non-hydrolyzing) [Gammaproteobacteria bacterium]|jgi:UDP-N-acetylglucosamine 2-epimerase (non-hydrolysing)
MNLMRHKKLKLLLVAGARPNFMKIAPIVRECDRRSDDFEYRIVHTGQHYDSGMSDIFFEELGIPEPHYHLEVGSGGHSEQTATIMSRFDPICAQEKPDCVVVVGDVNSTLACTIVAKKMHLPVAHVEAGLRSGDRGMPEEINRLVTDSITDYFFVTEPSGVEHLEREGHSKEQIFFVGHVMIDNLFFELNRLGEHQCATKVLELVDGLDNYGVVTLHRPSNVDSKEALAGIMNALNEISKSIDLIFPVHPRTKQRLVEFGFNISNRIHLLEPLGYRDFLKIWKDAKIVLTDSGGLQEETTALGVPCLTLRDNTERPITITMGTNKLVGNTSETIISEARRALAENVQNDKRPPLWDGSASMRILDALYSTLKK